MDKISILIPVYRESDLLEPLLTDLIEDKYPSKEVFVIIDRPTDDSLSLAERYGDQVRFILNEERIGKANVLNKAFSSTTGDILLFIDSDVKLEKKGDGFLESVVKEIENYDILDMKKKTFRNSLLSRLVHYEYFFSSLVSSIFSKKMGKCLGLNGAAFAIRRGAFQKLEGFRRTISEDFDLATRAFLKDLSYKYTNNIEVSVMPPSNWRSWYKQRKRWSLATGLWVKDYYHYLGRIMVKHPQVLLPSLSIMLPSLFMLLSSYLVPDVIYNQATYLSEYVLASYQGPAMPMYMLETFDFPFTKNLMTLLLTYSTFSGFYFLSAKKLGYSFNPVEFFLFYFIYSPIFITMIAVGLVRVAIHRDRVNLDWKV